MMIKVVLANSEGSIVQEIDPSEFVLIDLRDYDEDKDVSSVRITTEKPLFAMPGLEREPQKEKLFDDAEYKASKKNPWEFV